MKSRFYLAYSVFSFLLLFFVLILHFGIGWLPLLCILLGILARVVFKSGSLAVFTFLIPLLPALGAFENKGFPMNYLFLPLFFLGGIVLGEYLSTKGQKLWPLPELPKFYFSFLLLLGISFIFVMLRWSNLTLSLLAFFKDTPIAPTGQRISFGIIFPVLELALFALSPFYFLLLRRRPDRQWILIAFLSGHSLSILYLLGLRLGTKDSPLVSLRGLASDPTAFGFLSSLALLLAWYLFFHYGRKLWGSVFAFISLVGILNSGTRIGFFAIVLVFFLFLFSSREKIISVVVLGILLVGAFFLYVHFFYKPGFNFLTRMKDSLLVVEKSPEFNTMGQAPLNLLSSHRDVLWKYSMECMQSFPITGVGPGNFVFWVMFARTTDFLHHLPANQYLFFTCSSGLPGLALFLLFCGGLFFSKKWHEKALLGFFFFTFLFNDYLWFPEIILVFWLVCSLGGKTEEKPLVLNKRSRIFYVCGLLVLIFFNCQVFSRLHPKSWARATSTPYDYGLYYEETDKGRPFWWTKSKAGVYIYLDHDGGNRNFRLVCGAPLKYLKDHQQTVEIFWRGRFFKRVVFRDNGEYPLLIEDKNSREGFLEFRIQPVFNLSRMGLGQETRTLGLQLFGEGKPNNR